MKEKIKIKIFPDGSVRAETENITGPGCADYIKILEEILEAKTARTDYKPEFYMTEKTVQEQINHQNIKYDK